MSSDDPEVALAFRVLERLRSLAEVMQSQHRPGTLHDEDEWPGSGADHAAMLYELLDLINETPAGPGPGEPEPTTRGGWAESILLDYPGWDGIALSDLGADSTLDRYLLIERNQRGSDPSYYVTTHEDPDDAADYSVNQEYAEDWSIEALFDLDTGAEVPGRLAARWETT